MFINVGASADGRRIKTKKQLKDMLRLAPDCVLFDTTSLIGKGPGTYTPRTIPEGVKLSVIGPDPYRERKWYATVSRNADGTVKVA